jgi:hypothetical protein
MLWLLTGGCSEESIDTSGFANTVALADEVDTAAIMPWIYRLAFAHKSDQPVSNDGFPPGELFPSDHLTRDSAVSVVMEAFASIGFEPYIMKLGEGEHAAYNVVADWPGQTKADEVILIGSHLDAFYQGADDNTSAVAASIEAARAVTRHRFARTIRFVVFDLEEFGAVGSTRFVEAGMADDVKFAIVLDLVGYASNAPGSQKDVMGINVPDKGDFLFVIGNRDSEKQVREITLLGNSMGLAKATGLIAPGDGTYLLSSVFMRSDHGLMWYRGIPAVFFTDGANTRNPHYHTAGDTPETLDPVFLGNNTRLLTAAIAHLAIVMP